MQTDVRLGTDRGEASGIPADAGLITFTITPGSSTCGGPFFPPPAAPLSGEVDNASGTKIADLGVDCL